MSVRFTAGFITQAQADALNRLFARPSLGDVWAVPPLQMTRGPGGQPAISLPPPESWWAKLTDEDAGAWTHEEWWESEPGTWEVKPLGVTGTLDAYPIDGTTGVVDRIVRMWQSRSVADTYEFDGANGALDPEVWARIVTPLPYTDPGPYEAVGVELVGGVWQDKSPQVDYEDIYRAPSNSSPPIIPAGQRVRLIPSPTDDGAWEIAAVGGMHAVEFTVLTDLCTQSTFRVTARDALISTVSSTTYSPSFVGPILTDASFDADTCVFSKTQKWLVIDWCTRELSLVDEEPGTAMGGLLLGITYP